MHPLLQTPPHFPLFLFSLTLQDAVFFSCGDSLSSKGMTYLTNSLFDYRSPENNGVRAEFILDAANHKVDSPKENVPKHVKSGKNIWKNNLFLVV